MRPLLNLRFRFEGAQIINSIKIENFYAGCLLAAAFSTGAGATELSVATFNVWGAGSNEGKAIRETVAVLKGLEADVLALQEIRSESEACDAEHCGAAGASFATELGEALGYFVFEQSAENEVLWANAILSRYPIAGALPHDIGAIINVDGDEVAVFNVHLTDYPYQPYQLTHIEYGDAPFLESESAAIASAESARGAAVDFLLDTASGLGHTITIICGDFNEPSHLDWTESAAQIGRNPLAVMFPASQKIAGAGFIDAYRSYRMDEIAHPGFTWTPIASLQNKREHHDRIDFVYPL
jgi:endonuclease/exonuclease/phosphatase family metal-dependent hydrolase